MYAGFVRKQGDIHTFEDEAFLRHMARGSVVVLALGAVAVLAFGACLALCAPALLDPGLSGLVGTSALDGGAIAAWLFAFAIATALSFIVHELVHGLCFKCFAPAGSKVTFGADLGLGMLYACADGVVFTRRQYLAALLAPSVVVTAALLALGCALGYPVLGAACAVLHLSGCTGDWGYARAIAADECVTHCEDTSWGVQFYCDLKDRELP